MIDAMQEPACYALSVLANSTSGRDQAKTIIQAVQQNLIRLLQPPAGVQPSLAQVTLSQLPHSVLSLTCIPVVACELPDGSC